MNEFRQYRANIAAERLSKLTKILRELEIINKVTYWRFDEFLFSSHMLVPNERD